MNHKTDAEADAEDGFWDVCSGDQIHRRGAEDAETDAEA